MNICKAVDKEYEEKNLKELADAPISCLQGISDRQAQLLEEAFKVKTVRDLAKLRFVKWAQAIVDLADCEN